MRKGFSLFLIALLISVLAPWTSVFAAVNYSGGVLDGKGVYLHAGNEVNASTTPDMTMTDNNPLTSEVISPSSNTDSTIMDNAYVDLGTNYTITPLHPK